MGLCHTRAPPAASSRFLYVRTPQPLPRASIPDSFSWLLWALSQGQVQEVSFQILVLLGKAKGLPQSPTSTPPLKLIWLSAFYFTQTVNPGSLYLPKPCTNEVTGA